MTDEEHQAPEYGPGGYLPQRAAQRARKIVLREQMGIGWPLAAVAAAVVVAVVGVVFLLTRGGPPSPPFLLVGPVEEAEPGDVTVVDLAGTPVELLVVRAGDGVRVFEAPDTPVLYCPPSRRLEAPGAVWNLRGRLVGGDGDSLQPLASHVHDGQLYVDPTSPLETPAPAPAPGETPACAPPAS